MSKRIIYETVDGVVVLIPSPNTKLTLEEIQAKDVPAGIASDIVDVSVIPTDRTFRGAWEKNGKSVGVSMSKARAIHSKSIGKAAKVKLDKAKDDMLTQTNKSRKARKQGDTIKEQEAEDILDSLADEMERLAELEEGFDLSGASTPEELLSPNYWPTELM